MPQMTGYLRSQQPRARWMRADTVQIIKRFFFCERALIISQAAQLPRIAPLEIKTELPRFLWQDSLTAHALRQRVFELRYPSRVVEQEGADFSLVALLSSLADAPSVAAFLHCLGETVLPALRDAYRSYLDASDPIADGPTYRFLFQGCAEKEDQIATVRGWAQNELAREPHAREEATAWSKAVAEQLSSLGGIGTSVIAKAATAAPLPASRPYSIPDRPARDSRFWPCRFYWPDIVDPFFPYGEGITLQLRCAISHLNEVWAVETSGAILSALARELPWEWIHDSARWTYDESRHCRMGYERLKAWGISPAEVPLGTYIYDSAAGQDPIYRLGMLYFFETKNIRHKTTRARLFREYGDAVSEHDMDFDWADETIHASYGRHWLRTLLSARGQDPSNYETIRERCGELVQARVASVTPEEISALKKVANALIEKVSRSS